MHVSKSCDRMRRNKCGVSPRAQKPVGYSHFGHCKWNTWFSRKKNDQRRRLPSYDYLRPRDLGLLGMDEEFVPGSPWENHMQSPRGGFLWTSWRGRRGFRPNEILPLHPSSLLLKLERLVIWLLTIVMNYWCYDRGVSTVKFCTVICAYGTWTLLLVAPHISERK